MKNFIVFDTETTGLMLPEGAPLDQMPKIIEFAAIKLNDELVELDRIEFKCHPGGPLPPEIVKATGITDADLAGSMPFPVNIPALQHFFLGAHGLIAHNVMFDVGILAGELQRLELVTKFPWPPIHICTVEASQHLKNKRLKLGELYSIYTGKEIQNWHRAMGDVESLVEILRSGLWKEMGWMLD